jgi:hypothetical protein
MPFSKLGSRRDHGGADVLDQVASAGHQAEAAPGSQRGDDAGTPAAPVVASQQGPRYAESGARTIQARTIQAQMIQAQMIQAQTTCADLPGAKDARRRIWQARLSVRRSCRRRYG